MSLLGGGVSSKVGLVGLLGQTRSPTSSEIPHERSSLSCLASIVSRTGKVPPSHSWTIPRVPDLGQEAGSLSPHPVGLHPARQANAHHTGSSKGRERPDPRRAWLVVCAKAQDS